MFENQNHIHAIATVIGTLGGFQQQPDWFKAFAKTSLWQILMSTILIYQGGGNLSFTYSLVVAILFYTGIHLTSYIKFNMNGLENTDRSSHQTETVPSAEATEQEAESFLGYY